MKDDLVDRFPVGATFPDSLRTGMKAVSMEMTHENTAGALAVVAFVSRLIIDTKIQCGIADLLDAYIVMILRLKNSGPESAQRWLTENRDLIQSTEQKLKADIRRKCTAPQDAEKYRGA